MSERSRFVVVDLETRSACDLKKHGGHLYATHPTTRLLCVPWYDGEYHVWLPGVDRPIPPALLTTHLPGVVVHTGPEFPDIPTDRHWVGHNCFGFDEPVWKELAPAHLQPRRWIDTYCLALASGLPGGLGQIGERLWGEGKYQAGSAELTKASRAKGVYDCDPENVPLGSTLLVARYAVQDVRLTVALLDELDRTLHMTPHELQVLAAHRVVNNRGVRVDAGLVTALYRLSNEAVADCVKRIAELTEDENGVPYFPDTDSLRKRTRVLDWVKQQGVDFGDSLRREVVAEFVEGMKGELEEPERDEEEDGGTDVTSTKNLKLVVEVLQLRQAAMRITGAKLEAAGNRVDVEGIARGLFAYYGAHTGRWAGRGIQVQNLPRPKEGVPVWPLLRCYREQDLGIDPVRRLLTAEQRRVNVKRAKDEQPLMRHPATADDAASGLIRSLFVPHRCGRCDTTKPRCPRCDECLLAADLAAIEVRVLNWLAGVDWMMDVFRAGGDPYIEFCRKVTGRTIMKKDPLRQVFKVLILGAGYQLGADGFAVYAAANGVDLEEHGLTPQGAIDLYRDAYPEIAGRVQHVFDGGRKWRTGGLWNDFNAAAIQTVQTGAPTEAGRCKLYKAAGHLYVVLPSGRELVYRNAGIETVHKWGKDRPQVVYSSPRFRRTRVYGGKWCWSGDTLILTESGPKPIRGITTRDRIWDGVGWVRHDGVAHNGMKEVGSWLGQSVTGDHLIADGESWKPLTASDAEYSARSLRNGAASLPSEWSYLAAGRGPRRGVCATVETTVPSKLDACCGGLSTLAPRAGSEGPDRNRSVIGTCSRPQPCIRCGPTGTRGSYPDAPTPSTGRTGTTGAGESGCTGNGCWTDGSSSSTPSHCKTGTGPDSISTAGTTRDTTNQGTYVWSPDPSTVRTDVYDIVNCGPRHRYTVVTPYGCVIAHNCENITQAVASDFIRHSLVLCEQAGIKVVLHVHDEIVASGWRDQLPLFMKLMTSVPSWAPGFPLAAEGGWLPRYAKAPPKGKTWKEQEWRDGVRVK